MATTRSQIIGRLTKLDNLVTKLEEQPIDANVKAKLKDVESLLDDVCTARCDVTSASSDLDTEVDNLENAFSEVIKLLE